MAELVLTTSLLLCVLLFPAFARPERPCHGRSFAFSFPDFSKDLDSLSLLGDASVSESHLLISGSQPHSVGALFFSSPVRLRKHHRPSSFITSFSFSMSSQQGDGLAFVISPSKNFAGMQGPWLGLSPSDQSSPSLPHTLAIEFDTSMNSEVLDPNDNHVGVDVESLISLVTANVSDSLNDGGQLFVWIDYIAPLGILEVRMSKLQSQRPQDPILSHKIDLSDVWKKEMFVGFSSSTGNTPQKHIIHSWSFATMDPWFGRHGEHPDRSEFHHGFPGWHHPRPGFADWHHHPRPGFPEEHHHPRPGFPGFFPEEHHHGFPDHHGPHGRHGPPHLEDDSWLDNMSDVWRIVISLLFGATCGTAVAVIMLALWALIRRRFMATEESENDVGMLYGYQKLITPEADAKVDANGYQKLPTTGTEAKTENI